MVRYLTGKAIYLLGKAAKGLFYAVHIFAPRLRFEMPAVARPLSRRARREPIPNIVWQTNYSRTATLAVYTNYLFNRLMAPTFEFRLVVDEEADEFVRSTFPGETWENYRRLQIGAAKADFWRLLTIYHHGGAYMDIDATLTWPLASTLRSRDEVFLTHGQDFTNYFLAAKPGTPNFADLIIAINRNIAQNKLTSVYDLTGPTVLIEVLSGRKVSSVAYDVACRQAMFTNNFFQYRDRPDENWGIKQRVVPIVADD